MPKKYQLLTRFVQYVSKPDPTNSPRRALIQGSQNVLINDQEKITTRKGYTLLGSASTDTDPTESSFDWKTSKGGERNLRGKGTVLEVYDTNTTDWIELSTGFSAVDFQFATWWDTSEGIELLLFVNGNDYFWDWSGGMAVLSSATANTITKTGTSTWAEEGFLTSGTRRVIINGTAYTYTGGESSTTLTGVSPNPSSEAANSTIHQEVRLNDNQPADGVNNDIISVLNNQVYIGSLTSNEVYVSSNTDFTDYTLSTPRVPGEGALLTLDKPAVAFIPQEQDMYITAGRDEWYYTKFHQLDVGGVLSETLEVKKLKTGAGMAAQSQNLTALADNDIVFLDNNQELHLLGRVEDVEEPQFTNISDPIKTDFDASDFTNGHIKAHKNRIYITEPVNDKLWINEVRIQNGEPVRFWQPPQILPIRMMAIRSDDIHAHSNGAPESYKLFDGTNDNGGSMSAIMKAAYRNYGSRVNLKTHEKWLTEGYISSNTILTLQLNYDFEGSTDQPEKEIDGADDGILFEVSGGAELGGGGLGDAPIGMDEEESSQLPKFKVIHDFAPKPYHEIQVVYSSDGTDQQWEILATGGAVLLSPIKPTSIHR